MPDPVFKTRTVTRPDGSRLTAGWLGEQSDIEELSDEEFLAAFDTWRDKQQPLPATRTPPAAPDDNITDLATARMRRHTPGEPFTPHEIGSFLTGQNPGLAAMLTDALNTAQARIVHDDPT